MAKSRLLLQLPVECTMDDEAGTGIMHMKLAETGCTAEIDGRVVGGVIGCLGGGVELHDARLGKTFYLDPKDLWGAFQEALESQ